MTNVEAKEENGKSNDDAVQLEYGNGKARVTHHKPYTKAKERMRQPRSKSVTKKPVSYFTQPLIKQIEQLKQTEATLREVLYAIDPALAGVQRSDDAHVLQVVNRLRSVDAEIDARTTAECDAEDAKAESERWQHELHDAQDEIARMHRELEYAHSSMAKLQEKLEEQSTENIQLQHTTEQLRSDASTSATHQFHAEVHAESLRWQLLERQQHYTQRGTKIHTSTTWPLWAQLLSAAMLMVLSFFGGRAHDMISNNLHLVKLE